MKNKEKGISRIDKKGVHGYQVIVCLKGKKYSKLFSDSKWNGPEKARDEAISWRDEKEKEIRTEIYKDDILIKKEEHVTQ